MLRVQSVNAIVVSGVDSYSMRIYPKLSYSSLCMGQVKHPLKINNQE